MRHVGRVRNRNTDPELKVAEWGSNLDPDPCQHLIINYYFFLPPRSGRSLGTAEVCFDRRSDAIKGIVAFSY